VELPNEHIDLI